MKRKNGFTLIELLAVIVILAVIALIATPIILNVIDNAKKGAAKNSMYGYVEAVELDSAKVLLTQKKRLTGTYTTKEGNLYLGSEKVLSVSFKGTKPEDGGTIELVRGMVKKAELTFNGHSITYESSISSGEETTTPSPTSTPSPTPTPTPSYHFLFGTENSGYNIQNLFKLQEEGTYAYLQGLGLTPAEGTYLTGEIKIEGKFQANVEYTITTEAMNSAIFRIGIYSADLTILSQGTTFKFTPKKDVRTVTLCVDIIVRPIEEINYLKITVK